MAGGKIYLPGNNKGKQQRANARIEHIVKKDIKKALKVLPETKFTAVVKDFQNASAVQVAANTAYLQLLNGTGQGIANGSRIGNSISNTMNHMMLTVTAGATGSNNADVKIRYGITFEKCADQGALVFSGSTSDNMFEDYGISRRVNMFKSINDAKGDIQVLIDKVRLIRANSCNSTTAGVLTTISNVGKHIDEWHKKLGGRKTKFINTGNAIGDISEGSLYFWFIADQACTLEYSSRSDYTDM